MKKNPNIVVIGETNFRNQRWRFGIKEDDRRRHMYVVGSTGMGKSEFLKNMAIQDIQAGRGVAYIDPHGDAVDDILDHVPPERIKDVIYFDPGDLEYPIAFNVMEGVHFDYRHLVASGLVGVFKKIWGAEAWSGRMEYILNNTILALLEYPDSTLLGINRLMANKDYRKKIISVLKDPIVKAFWVEEFAKYADKFATEATAAIQNKVGQFSSNSLIRNIIGQPKSKLDIRKLMDEGKILLANVSRGKIGEDASRLLGAFLVTKIQLAAMSRVDIPDSQRRDFYLYVDEFQHFATESFANILSEARKFHLNLIMAHQYIKQMEEPVRDAVFGNVGTIVSFRVGAEDAEFLEKWFSPDFLMADIVNLGKYNVYLKLMIDGISSKGFSAAMIPPSPKLAKSNRIEIVNNSRQMYATPRSEVERNIAEWAGMGDNQPPQSGPINERFQQPMPKPSPMPVRPQESYRQQPASQGYQRGEQYPNDRGQGGYQSDRQSNRPSYQERRDQAPAFQEPRRERYEEPRPQFQQPQQYNRPMQRPEPRENRAQVTQNNFQQARPQDLGQARPQDLGQARPMNSGPARQNNFEQSNRRDEPQEPSVYHPPAREPQKHEMPKHTPVPSSGGLSLNEALKNGPVNFRGRRIEDRKEKVKVEVNTDELRKVLEEAMQQK